MLSLGYATMPQGLRKSGLQFKVLRLTGFGGGFCKLHLGPWDFIGVNYLGIK